MVDDANHRITEVFLLSSGFGFHVSPKFLVIAVLIFSTVLWGCGGPTKLRVTTRLEPTPLSISNVHPGDTAGLTSLAPTIVAGAATPGPSLSPSNAGSIEFQPPQLAQGGYTIVYLKEDASSATLSFQGKLHPMLHGGTYWWAIVGVDASTPSGLIAASVTYTPIGDKEQTTVAASISIVKRDFPVEAIELGEDSSALLDPQVVTSELTQRASIFSGFTAQKMWSGPFVVPAEGSITSIYGEGRSYNGGPVTDFHRGTDFAGDTGDPVVAAAAGRVVFTGNLRIRGNSVIVDHGAGVYTTYNHLSTISVREGQAVKARDKIGAVGSTGLVTGPHLHWDVIVRGVEVDGRFWLQGLEVAP